MGTGQQLRPSRRERRAVALRAHLGPPDTVDLDLASPDLRNPQLDDHRPRLALEDLEATADLLGWLPVAIKLSAMVAAPIWMLKEGKTPDPPSFPAAQLQAHESNNYQ